MNNSDSEAEAEEWQSEGDDDNFHSSDFGTPPASFQPAAFHPFAFAQPSTAQGRYDGYLQAFSVDESERQSVRFGGKVLMPPSALVKLSSMDIPSPWQFELRQFPAKLSVRTHAGVLEFIAPEGTVLLPPWMMRQMQLAEGDKLRVISTALPPGDMIKVQPQSVDFLSLSDPKSTLEKAFQNYSALSPGDVVEIAFGSLRFDILIKDVFPDGPGISIVDVDLKVDFDAPKGYVEPAPQPRKAEPTMAQMSNIDINASTASSSLSTNTSRPFAGEGATLTGKKPRLSQQTAAGAAAIPPAVRRTDLPLVVTNDVLEGTRSAPAPLNLPYGQLFFGYRYVPFNSKPADGVVKSQFPETSGATLSGREPRAADTGMSPMRVTSPSPSFEAADGKQWGSGNILNAGPVPGPRRKGVIEIDSD